MKAGEACNNYRRILNCGIMIPPEAPKGKWSVRVFTLDGKDLVNEPFRLIPNNRINYEEVSFLLNSCFGSKMNSQTSGKEGC